MLPSRQPPTLASHTHAHTHTNAHTHSQGSDEYTASLENKVSELEVRLAETLSLMDDMAEQSAQVRHSKGGWKGLEEWGHLRKCQD